MKKLVTIQRPESEYPELLVTVPDKWPYIVLAPLYDVHIGSGDHDGEMFAKHLAWIEKTPYVLTWNGGDMCDNITPQQAAKMGQNPISPADQLDRASEVLAPLRYKMLFSIPGNHEDRSFRAAGIDSARWLAERLHVEYFAGYCFCHIKWRGMMFHLNAHHGSGGAQTAGAQRNAARKDLPWIHPDIIWTGHLHQPMSDTVFALGYDEKGRHCERSIVVMISPAYVKYFGSYAEKKRMGPGVRGLSTVTLQPDGRIDTSQHAQGKRL